MKTKSATRTNLWKLASGGLGICCSMFSVMGCYPLIPAYFTAVILEQRRNVWLYIGLMIGMIRFMNVETIAKYTFIILVIAVAMRFYLWANRKCNGWIAGLIAGIVTVALGLSGNLLWVMDRKEIVLVLSEGALALGLTVVLHYVIEMVGGWICADNSIGKKRRAAALDQNIYGDEKIDTVVEAFDGLANVFSEMSRPRERNEEQIAGTLQREITGKLCTSCDGCAICWRDSARNPALGIQELIGQVVAHQSKEEIMRHEYLSHCINYQNMVENAIQAFARMELNEAWYTRLLENRMVIAQQLDVMASMMQEWSKGNRCLDKEYRLELAKMKFEAKERGILIDLAHIYEDRKKHLYVQLQVESKWGGGIPSKKLLEAVERALVMPMRLERDARSIITKDAMDVTIYDDTVFYTLPGIATRKKDGSGMSGDNFSMMTLNQGEQVVMLSDGMGSGIEANKESELVVELLEKFLEAGFPRDAAIQMMNSAMVLQGENNIFSTLDLANIDLYTGQTSLVKIGAAASFVKRGDTVEILEAASLPAGAENNPQVSTLEKTLSHGDFLVMVTDGVLEYLHVKDPERKLSEIISEIRTENAGTLAKTILERILLFTGGYTMDDMTILVTGIWEK